MYFQLGTEADNLETMTSFVRQVRQSLDAIGSSRSRPYLLAVRVPDSPELPLNVGLDVEQWLKEDLIHVLIVGGGRMPYAGRLQEFIDMAHTYDVAAYPCLDGFRDPNDIRSIASNFWALGGDGVYIFGYEGLTDGSPEVACLYELGIAETLLGNDKLYLADHGGNNAEYGLVNPASQFPTQLIGDKPIELVVGDDLKQAAILGILDEVELYINISELNAYENIFIKVNGILLLDNVVSRMSISTFVVTLDPDDLSPGINYIEILPGIASMGQISDVVTDIKLFVCYK